MSNADQSGTRGAKWMHWIARVIGSLVGALYLFIGVASAFDDRTPWSWESTVLTVLVATAVLGIAVAWWRKGIGGAIVTADAIVFGVFAYITARFNKASAMLVSGGPLLVAGVLFLVSWWVSSALQRGAR